MKKLINYCAGVLISVLCVSFVGCNELDNLKQKGPEQPDSELQGVDVPFTVYSYVEGVSGDEIPNFRINPSYFATPWGEGKIFIINSDEELKRYVEDDYMPIDFSKQTLLLVGGGSTSSPVTKIVSSFQRSSNGNYKFELEISQGFADFGEGWRMAILTDKISNDSKIELNIITLNI